MMSDTHAPDTDDLDTDADSAFGDDPSEQSGADEGAFAEPDDEDDPFADDETAGESFDEDGADDDFFDIPPLPIGILNGYVSDCKKNPKKPMQVIVEIKLDEPEYPDTKVAVFIDMSRFAHRFFAICSTLGVPIETKGRRRGPAGGLKALKGKSAKWVLSSYRKDGDPLPQPTVAWGLPKPKDSPEWNEFAASANFTDAQIKTLKGSPGCVPTSF